MADSKSERSNRYDAKVTALVNGPLKTGEKQRTYVIVGNGRGGTSMVAGVAHTLGLRLKELEGYGGGGFEDADFVRVAQGLRPVGKPSPSNLSQNQIIESLRNTVEDRNAKYDVWGWKDPSSDRYLPEISDLLHNPHLIIVWRDPAATATALMAANGISAEDAFRVILHNIQRFVNLAESTGWPTLMVSYERGRLKPNDLAAEMAEFLGLELTEAKRAEIAEFCAPSGGYLTVAGAPKPLSVDEQKALRNKLERRPAGENEDSDSSAVTDTDDELASIRKSMWPEPLSGELQKYIKELESRIETQRDQYRAYIQALETQKETDAEQRDQYRTYIQALETQKETDAEQRDQYRTYIQALETQKETDAEQRDQYRTYIQALETQKETDAEQRDQYRTYIQALETQIQALEAQNETDAEQRDQYRTYIQALETQIQALEAQNETDAEQRDHYRSYIQALETQKETQRDAEEQRAEELQNYIDGLRTYITELETRLESQREEYRYRAMATKAARTVLRK